MISLASREHLLGIIPTTRDPYWWAMVSADDFDSLVINNRIVVGLAGDKAYFACGVSPLRLSGVVVPWIWLVFDVGFKKHLRFFFREDMPFLRHCLDVAAPGGYTAPEEDSVSYRRFLEKVGFRHLGHGLWQWRLSVQQ